MEYFNDIRNQIVSWAISIKRSKWLYVLIGFPLLISFVWFFSPLFAWPTQMRMSLYTVQRIYFKEIIIIFFAMSFFIQVILIDSLIGWMCAIKCFEHRQITIELWITHTHNPYTKCCLWMNCSTSINIHWAVFQWYLSTFSQHHFIRLDFSWLLMKYLFVYE